MSIVISIVKLPDKAVNTKTTHTFAIQGGTLGRSSENEWILEDPERFISSQHSQISFENGQYYLTDLSTNGTFTTGAAEPIGKGNTIKLNDGDKFSLGDYEFLASAWQEEENVSSNDGPFAAVAPIQEEQIENPEPAIEQDYFSSANPSNIDSFATPFSGHVSNADSLFSPEPVETDPLAALDQARHIPETNNFTPDSFSGMSQSDQADPMQQAVSWPKSTVETNNNSMAGGIPENWEIDMQAPAPEPITNKSNFLIDEPVAVKPAEDKVSNDKKLDLEKANAKILAEIEILKKQAQKQALQNQINKNTASQKSPVVTESAVQTSSQTSSAPRSSTNNEESLIDALGLINNNLSDEKVIEINQVVGELVRETITGMMQVLSSRSTIKNEFRMNVTTIQPVENNPLKFSANVDDATENMFIKDGNAYKKPVEAIKEGFEGIAEHQVAILAGIRTAFNGVLKRFDPTVLEQRFEQFNKPGIIPGMNKAKNWDSYKNYYQELVDDMDNSFQHLFGYEFVQAYEEQLQKIVIDRKSKS